MSARSVQVPGGWLVVCAPCDSEQFAPSLPAADRVAREHNRKHAVAVVEAANEVLW